MAEELHFENPAAAAQDPSTDAESLRQLAYRYPELRPVVAAHPHAAVGVNVAVVVIARLERRVDLRVVELVQPFQQSAVGMGMRGD